MTSPTDIQSIRAVIEFFQVKKENNWGIARIRAGAKKYVAVGEWPEGCQNGDIVEIVGTVGNHPQYGEQLAITRVVAHFPARADAIQEWLEARLPHVGPERAQAIVKKFGAELWNILDERPERLQEIPGLTPERVAELLVAYRQHAFERELVVQLLALGLNGRQATSALKRWGKETLPNIAQDPYLLFLEGITDFLLIDAIAKREYKVRHDDPRRVCALLRSLLDEELQKGSTTAIRHTLLQALARKLDLPKPKVEEILAVSKNAPFVLTEKNVSAMSAYQAEAKIAARVRNLMRAWS